VEGAPALKVDELASACPVSDAALCLSRRRGPTTIQRVSQKNNDATNEAWDAEKERGGVKTDREGTEKELQSGKKEPMTPRRAHAPKSGLGSPTKSPRQHIW